ncbi:hypothetical protein B6D16_13175 [Gilliamella apicola]|nr:hypothetical protein B6D05_13215 [Gilliamella apicola]OTQ12360.1 hypothetical protein B6D16_13175 [Gilliamella apicola]OTQ14342.1 hypothetical protein B6D15_13205 [Gilliamella apicola]OTQ26378.1 hypothetical protein B6D04_00035 [Gilliamella apicola]
MRNYFSRTKTWTKWAEKITTANINNYLPSGIPQPCPYNQPPEGWLECNGAEFDRNQFQKLAIAYPSGKLPDLRGEFIRGWDNARGVDPNRMILDWQQDTIRDISGQFRTFITGTVNGAFERDSVQLISLVGSSGTKIASYNISFNASNVVPVANENRPRNVAFMYIVKAE